MKQRAIFILLCAVLLSSCGNKQNNSTVASDTKVAITSNPFVQTTTGNDAIADNGAIDDDTPKISFSYNMREIANQEFVFTGKEITLSYTLTNEGEACSYDLMLFADGIPIAFSVNGAPASNCNRLKFDSEQEKEIKMKFTMPFGKKGDLINVVPVVMGNTNVDMPQARCRYIPQDYFVPAFFYASYIKMECDVDGTKQYCTNYTSSVIPAEILQDIRDREDEMEQGGEERNLLEDGLNINFASNNDYLNLKNYLVKSEQNQIDVPLIIYGAGSDTIYLSCYVDGKLLPVFDGAYTLKVNCVYDKMETYPLHIDLSDYPDAKTIKIVGVDDPDKEGNLTTNTTDVKAIFTSQDEVDYQAWVDSFKGGAQG
ncbi:MAG: hypothetical protein QM689_00325 [Oscillospiraceae bacterium]